MKVKCIPAIYVSTILHKEHIRTQHLEEFFWCSLCDHRSTSEYYLTEHIKNYHEGRKIKCNECQKLIGKSYIAKHMKIIHNPWEKPLFECKICTFTTKYQNEVSRHNQRVHKKPS